METYDIVIFLVAIIGLGVLAYFFLSFVDNQLGTKDAPRRNNDAADAIDEEIDNLLQQQDSGVNTKDAKKQLAKAMKKKEKAEKKAQDDFERETRKAREERRMEEEHKKDEERARRREEEEEHQRELEEEQRRREEEEFAKWEQYIVLEEEGYDAKEDLFSNETRLNDFINTLKTRKVTIIDEIAADFGLSNDEVLDAVKKLEDNGTMTVLVDDRGKLIYITEEEMARVVETINKHGRISLNKLTTICNTIIDMQGKENGINFVNC